MLRGEGRKEILVTFIVWEIVHIELCLVNDVGYIRAASGAFLDADGLDSSCDSVYRLRSNAAFSSLRARPRKSVFLARFLGIVKWKSSTSL